MYKLAFIGGSIESIAGYPHFIASQMDKRFKVVTGVFSTNDSINRKTAKQWHIKKYYSNIDQMIEKEKDNIDAIVILTPTPLHANLIIKIIQFKIPIICEKPLVSSLKDAEKIQNIINTEKNFLVVTNNYSGYPMVRELKQKIISNELGEILNIRLKMPQESFLRPPKSVKYPQKWRLVDEFIPGISLDLGSHLHHLAYFLTELEPSKLLASYKSFSKYNVIDDVNILLEYSNGISGNMWLSKTALGNRNGLHIEIYGTKASAMWHQENPEILEFSYNNGQKIILDRGSNIEMQENHLYNRMTPGHPAGFIESFANLYNDIADALDNFHKKKKYTNQYVYGFIHAFNGIKLLHTASLSNKYNKYENLH